ncbi:MAG: hypothetical protein HY952_06805 [Elusimicrobia bacterium]|nr:hypothetical protein [Elusimicrobiota bacterium]
MKKSNILAAGLTAVAVCVLSAAAFAAETDIMGNLTKTSDKISSIDMDKNLGEAGKVLDGFYSGVKEKTDASSSAVSLETGSRTLAQAEKEVCNAKPSKIVLSAKVPPLGSGTGRSDPKEKGLPGGSGLLIAGGVALALAGKKKGYFSNYGDNVDTVWNAVQHPIDTYNDISNCNANNQSYSNSQHNNNSSSDGTGNQNDTNLYGQYWLNQQLH